MLFALTILLSSFLLFAVQPMIARIILPWFGGSAAVWTVCLLFFQAVLLLGYIYAHWLFRRLRGRTQSIVHLALLGISLAWLPVFPAEHWKPAGADSPSLSILMLLAGTVGLPYLLLSTTAPLIQAWYAQRYKGAVPYRLYALSNIGSVAALASYPALVEPALTTHQQAWAWSASYALFAVVCGAVAITRGGLDMQLQEEAGPEIPRPPRAFYVLWMALAACASVLLLAVTNHLSQNVASIPFLWVLPLSLYLLTFILCFDRPEWYQRTFFLRLFAVALGAMAYTLSSDFENTTVKVLVPLFSSGLFICCMVCHGELVRLKPHPRYLTSFYLMIALGGALGGLFVALLAPWWFPGYFELHAGLALCAVLVVVILALEPSDRSTFRWKRPEVLAGACLTIVLVAYLGFTIREAGEDARIMVRNFYGTLKVTEDGDETRYARMRTLLHGTITHGEQFLDKRRDRTTTYYGPKSGAALAVRERQLAGPVRVGVVGLGTGTLAAYGRPGDTFHFYEINPLVIKLAHTEFTYLKDSKARIEIVLGDARLSLEREPPQRFDVLVLDAFSSDAIPVHLLTREAFELYFRHLNDQGVLAVHVSNKYLDLMPVVGRIAESLGKSVRLIQNDEDEANAVFSSSWVLTTTSEAIFHAALFHGAVRPDDPRRLRLWTDDYSNLFQILK